MASAAGRYLHARPQIPQRYRIERGGQARAAGAVWWHHVMSVPENTLQERRQIADDLPTARRRRSWK
eukprot:2190132-Rhodomonas_salina.1